MELTKIRNWSDDELKTQETQIGEQLFRIRFQAKLGQNEGVRKLRELRKDIARIKTIARERALGLHGAVPVEVSIAPVKVAKTKEVKAAKPKSVKPAAAKTAKQASTGTKKEAK
jgi:large subunit ribosomal protein L29